MSKRIMAFLLAAAMTLSMAACGSETKTETPAESKPAETTPAAPSTPAAPAETPEAPVEKTVAEMRHFSASIFSMVSGTAPDGIKIIKEINSAMVLINALIILITSVLILTDNIIKVNLC